MRWVVESVSILGRTAVVIMSVPKEFNKKEEMLTMVRGVTANTVEVEIMASSFSTK